MSETLPQSAPQSGAAVVGTQGPVLIIGAGLIGGSIGLALRRAGVDVYLRDASPTAMALG
ncbi:prephenate dehydrogenase, partial [Mobiluncus curtisii]|nr:prephenate dehydrogenase [Mobiluncus curtisii]